MQVHVCEVVGSNPRTVYWIDMTFFTLICCKNVLFAWKDQNRWKRGQCFKKLIDYRNANGAKHVYRDAGVGRPHVVRLHDADDARRHPDKVLALRRRVLSPVQGREGRPRRHRLLLVLHDRDHRHWPSQVHRHSGQKTGVVNILVHPDFHWLNSFATNFREFHWQYLAWLYKRGKHGSRHCYF